MFDESDIIGLDWLDRVDLDSIHRIKPIASLLSLNIFLFRIEVVTEGIENICEPPYIVAINHPDRFSVMPIMLEFMKKRNMFPSVWAKAKYLEHPFIGNFLVRRGCIPVTTKKYLISKTADTMFNDNPLTFDDYGLVKKVIDGDILLDNARASTKVPELLTLLNQADHISDYHEQLMIKVGVLSRKALYTDQRYMFILPEGTRSKRLGIGKPGLAELVLHTGVPIIPIGCNGGELIYPGNSPWAKQGVITYRIGDPITIENQLKDFVIPDETIFFSRESQKFRTNYEKATSVIMSCIEELLDPEYQSIA